MVGFLHDGFFSDEEKMVLNRLAVNVSNDECCEQLLFGAEVTGDEDCVSLFSSLREKVASLSVEEWDNLQSFLPFETSVLEEDFDESVFETEGV